MSGDAEQEYFADGISEDIITALSKLPQLFVIARNSSFTFKGRNVAHRRGREEPRACAMSSRAACASPEPASGSPRSSSTRTTGHLWAERFDRELTDIFAVQDDVTTQIVKALALNLSPGDRQNIAAEHTDNQEAYDCFLRGRELWWRHDERREPRGGAAVAARDRTRSPLRPRLRLPRRGESERLCERVERVARTDVQGSRRGRPAGGATRRALPVCALGARRRLPLGATPRRSCERGGESGGVQSELRRGVRDARLHPALRRPLRRGRRLPRPAP